MSVTAPDFSCLQKAPFHLENEALTWVKETLAGMTEKEKLAQLFCINVRRGDEEEFRKLKEVYGGIPGGVMYRPMSTEKAVSFYNQMLREAEIPPLVAANLEKGKLFWGNRADDVVYQILFDASWDAVIIHK